MKTLVKLIAVSSLVFLTSGCSTSQSKMESLNGNGCNNPKCQCPKPCQCGSGCRCGMGGNSNTMNGGK